MVSICMEAQTCSRTDVLPHISLIPVFGYRYLWPGTSRRGIPLAGIKAMNGERTLRAGGQCNGIFMIYGHLIVSYRQFHSRQIFPTSLTDQIPGSDITLNREKKQKQLN